MSTLQASKSALQASKFAFQVSKFALQASKSALQASKSALQVSKFALQVSKFALQAVRRLKNRTWKPYFVIRVAKKKTLPACQPSHPQVHFPGFSSRWAQDGVGRDPGLWREKMLP
jgi:hypothetical protein